MPSLIVSPPILVQPTIPVGTTRPQVRTMGNVVGGFNPTTDFTAAGQEPNFPTIAREGRLRNVFEIPPKSSTASKRYHDPETKARLDNLRARQKKYGFDIRGIFASIELKRFRETGILRPINYNREQPIGTTSMRYSNSNTISPSGIPASALTTPMGLTGVNASGGVDKLSTLAQPLLWIAIGVFVLFGMKQ